MNIEQYEHDIFHRSCDLERISILEKKSRARLQIFHRNNTCYIRSINDKYKNIRILLLALAVNICHNNHRERLNRLKEIIYRSELNLLTVSRGLLKEELHKNVGMNLELARFGENVEHQLVKCFNCVAFFDQVLASSFSEYFLTSSFDSFEMWQRIISLAFEIDIRLIDKSNTSHELAPFDTSDCLFLEREGDSIYMASNYKQNFQTDTIIDNSVSSIQQIEMDRKPNNLLTVSIDNSFQSPSTHPDKENINHQNAPPKGEKITCFQSKIQLERSRRNKKSSFWNFFCCGVD